MTPRDLIETIAWYRDHYHKIDLGHNDMIARLRPLVGKRLTPKEQDLVDLYDQTVEGWLNMDEVPELVEAS